MTQLRFCSIQLFIWGPCLSIIHAHSAAAELHREGPATYTRQATFELTFANQDLIWFGDPASPTALVYPKPGARPIATDFHVRTVKEVHQSRARRYLSEARIVSDNDTRKVYAYTKAREVAIGEIDRRGHFSPNDAYENRALLPSWPADASVMAYDAQKNALFYQVEVPGPLISESLDFLPLELVDAQGNKIGGRFSIDFEPPVDGNDEPKSSFVSLSLKGKQKSLVLATATLPRVFCRADVEIGSFDNKSGTYLPEAAYRASATAKPGTRPSVTVRLAGEFTPAVKSEAESLTIVDTANFAVIPEASPPNIKIDGNFDDWQNVAGIDDPRGDVVPYLDYVPDVDILEFKVAHDDEHICYYVRVAGQVGRSHPDGGRSYFYAYMDVDQNPGTGFLPSRDDECYYGVDIGDDCEVQFEFVNNAFRKTFYGFCGLGGNEKVLQQHLTLGKSVYGRFDASGVERANYKSEYTFRDGVTEITEDLKRGTSDTIHIAVSPDGHEVEVSSTFSGFLKDSKGRPTVKLGQTIDVTAGMECDSKAYVGKSNWAADNTIAIRGYKLTPMIHHSTAKKLSSE